MVQGKSVFEFTQDTSTTREFEVAFLQARSASKCVFTVIQIQRRFKNLFALINGHGAQLIFGKAGSLHSFLILKLSLSLTQTEAKRPLGERITRNPFN